ncbi:MAG: permease [Verrucomicrobia bacterium]|nr:permease [Verrucomicrobiota bacterium]
MYESNPFIVADAPAAARAAFYRRTYGLVAASLVAFGVALYGMFVSGIAQSVMNGLGSMLGSLGGWSMLLIMLAFWGGSTVAQSLAFNRASRGSQYLGLGLYILLQALIFIPIIAYTAAATKGNPGEILVPACLITGVLAAGLTATVFMSSTDFSFLRTVIVIASFCALGAIVVSIIAGWTLGAWFSTAMIVLMASVILYQTHEIKNTMETDQHVAAAFVLFSSFVTLLFYVIRLFLDRRDD